MADVVMGSRADNPVDDSMPPKNSGAYPQWQKTHPRIISVPETMTQDKSWMTNMSTNMTNHQDFSQLLSKEQLTAQDFKNLDFDEMLGKVPAGTTKAVQLGQKLVQKDKSGNVVGVQDNPKYVAPKFASPKNTPSTFVPHQDTPSIDLGSLLAPTVTSGLYKEQEKYNR